MKSLVQRHGAWLAPLLIFAMITPFTPSWDLALSHYFYIPEKGFSNHEFYSWIYTYGLIPAQFLAAVSAMMLCASAFFKRWKNWYAPSLILVLTLAIGSGLIVHALLKDHWGRPRPKQVVEFGGTLPYRPYYEPNLFYHPETLKSFPCGHCSMGFYFFALALIAYYRKQRALFWSALTAALVLGFLLSWTRIAQGGHFLSDVLASALIMWLTGYFCTRLILQGEEA